ncbi:MAG TPA: cation-transporting P-type ATPase, partial [Isosphaeraceae bacterium]|nr:cation-transporting P-type ATPase [Isosphaeraceae bacterium]
MATESTSQILRSSPGPHAATVDDLLGQLHSDPERGLTDAEAKARLARLGPNQLADQPPRSKWLAFLGQFLEPVIGILIAAALIAGLMGEWVDTLAILAIVALNGVLGFLQEERAERALAALQKLSAPMAKAVRDGSLRSIPARDLVPGDCIVLEAGDSVPADARLIHSFGLRIQEAALTGESLPASKQAEAMIEAESSLGDRRNMVYMGTTASSGKADAVVVATGMNTELGRIAGMLERTEREPTPLQKRLADLGRTLILLVLSIVALILLFRLLRDGDFFDSFLIAVSLAVAAVPEGLPAVVTLALAVGLQRLVKRNAL